MIVQVLLSERIGGAESLVADLGVGWKAMTHESETVYLDPEQVRSGRWRRLIGLRKELKRLNPALVVAHSYLPALYARVASIGVAPVHVVLHSGSDDFARVSARILERILLPITASVIAVSEAQLTRYRAHFGNTKRATVILNRPSCKFSPKPAISSVPRRVVTLARVDPVKRPLFWRQVVELASEKYPDLRFEWWGPLSGDTHLDSALNEKPPLAGSYCGSTDSPSEVLRMSDVLFHTSAHEANSLAMQEAAGVGLPVIYADSIEPPTDSVVWGLRYTRDDPADAVRVLGDLLADWDLHSARSHAEAVAQDQRVEPPLEVCYLDWMVDSNLIAG